LWKKFTWVIGLSFYLKVYWYSTLNWLICLSYF
jgi:hypothetical protein